MMLRVLSHEAGSRVTAGVISVEPAANFSIGY